MPEPENSVRRFVEVCRMLEAISDEQCPNHSEGEDPESEINLTGKMNIAVGCIMKLYWQARSVPPSPATRVTLDRNEMTVNICREVSETPNISIHTAAYFADKHHVSESTVRNYFRQKLGVSLHQYITRCCMRTARQLKKQEKLTIEQVAEKLGYADKSGFLKACRRYQQQKTIS